MLSGYYNKWTAFSPRVTSKQKFHKKGKKAVIAKAVIAKAVIARERFAQPSLLTSPGSDRGNLRLCREPSTPIGRLPRSLPGL